MEIHMEYPKALYRQGECAHVHDEAEEAAKREEGFADWTADHEAMNPPKKATIETKTYADGTSATGTPPLPDQSPAEQKPAPLDREALKARATELKIDFPRNITTEKLAELVAAHA